MQTMRNPLSSTTRIPLSRTRFPFASPLDFFFPRLSLSPYLPRPFTLMSSLSVPPDAHAPPAAVTPRPPPITRVWKPMCLYYTQGKCTKMDDPPHLEIFNHSYSLEIQLNAAKVEQRRSQPFDYFLVLDLEGKVEILEFPVLLINTETLEAVDLFHRFVRPTVMSEQRINEYIEGKYGKFGVDRVWHDTAIPFYDVLQQFEIWLVHHQLWAEELDGGLNRAAFVTCGNWDLKTKVPEQCKVLKRELPPYFMEWINLKDVYLNFYKRKATGMMSMMKQLKIPSLGSHHLGIDDTKNIARILQHMISDGAVLQISARRNPNSPKNVEFLFKNRII